MNKILNLLLSVSLILCFTQCNDKNKKNNENNSQNTENIQELSKNFTAKVNGSAFNASKAFYEAVNGSLIITAIADDYSKIFISLNNSQPGTFNLDSTSFFTNDESTFYINFGKLTYQKDDKGLISGTFSFSAALLTDKTKTVNVTDGKFEQIYAEQSLSGNTSKFNSTQHVDVDVDAGKITNSTNSVEISITDQNVIFSNKTDISKSFTVAISKTQKDATASIYYSSSPKYDYIFIDNLKNTVTVFYKNGNTTTFN